MSSGSESTCSDYGGSDMGEGLMSVVRPAIHQLDAQVESTKLSQVLLATRIQELSELLREISEDQPYDLDVYARKLNDSRRRVTASGKLLENIHERLIKLQRDVARKSHVVKSDMTSPPPQPPTR